MRLRRLFTALIIGAGLCVAGTTPAAYAAPGAGVIHTVRNLEAMAQRSPESRSTGYYGSTEVCLDADSGTIGSNRTVVQLWECNDHSQQDWYYEPVNSSEAVIKNRRAGSGFCLDADTNTMGSNGTKVQLWECNGTSQQLWRGFGTFTITNVRAGTGFCLDADLNTIRGNGTRVQLWGCNGSTQQRWNLLAPATKRCANFSVSKPGGGWTFDFRAGQVIHVDVTNASLSSANITVKRGDKIVYHGVLSVNQSTTFEDMAALGTDPMNHHYSIAADGASIKTIGFTVRSYIC